MYINKALHEGREQSVLAAQILGWMYESHCWVDGAGQTGTFQHKVCLWCEAISKVDMKVEDMPGKEPCLCTENPVVLGASLSAALGMVPKKAKREIVL